MAVDSLVSVMGTRKWSVIATITVASNTFVSVKQFIDLQSLNAKIYFITVQRASHGFLEAAREHPQFFFSFSVLNYFEAAAKLQRCIILGNDSHIRCGIRFLRIPAGNTDWLHQTKKKISIFVHCFSRTL